MREYGQIQCAFWHSDEIAKASDDTKLLAAYLLTGPHSNGCGCYVCPDAYVIGDLRWSQERVSQAFAELSANRYAYRFGTVVFIRKFLAWNSVANGNVASARMKEFHALPKGDAKGLLAGAILRFCKHISADDRKLLETVSKTVPETLYQTVWQTRSDPTQPNPNQNQSDHENAPPESKTGAAKGDEPPTDTLRASGHAQAQLSPDFGDKAQAVYPECTGRRSWSTALHHAGVIVSSGRATEAQLLERLQGYREHVNSEPVTRPEFVYTPQNWFDPMAEDPVWAKDWKAKPSKDEQREDETIEAGRRFLAGTGT